MDGFAESAGSFPMDDADFEDTLFPTLDEIFGDKLFDVARVERVQVEGIGDGVFRDWIDLHWVTSTTSTSSYS